MTPNDIKLLRQRLGLNHKSFANLCGLTSDEAAKRARGWETGAGVPSTLVECRMLALQLETYRNDTMPKK